jgi:hypothetical protein
MNSKGVVDITINGKKRDSGRFIFYTAASERPAMMADFETKCEEFFQWYSNFQNKDPVHRLELTTSDVKCENGCRFSAMDKFSAVDNIIDSKTIREVVDKYAQKYNIKVELKL